MVDDGPDLEPVARRGPPVVWLGGLVVVLVVVAAIAVGGRPGLEPPVSREVAVASAPAAANSLPTIAPAASGPSSPAPIWYRPSPWPMGEDGLAGGTVFSSPRPSADPGDFDPLR